VALDTDPPYLRETGLGEYLSPVVDLAEGGSANFAPLYPDEMPLFQKVETIAKLGSNENPLGPSPALRRLFSDIGELARLYPDPQGRALCTRLADSFGVDSRQVILGNGSEDLIGVICRSVVRPGDTVATLYPSFPLHEDYTALMGGRIERVAVTENLTVDMAALLAAAARKPRMLMFSNPMNPVGCWLTPDELAANAARHRSPMVARCMADYLAGRRFSLDLVRHYG